MAPPEPLPWPLHPTLEALLPRLVLTQDCWDLLANRKQHYLPRGDREPEAAYRRRLEAALPSGFFRDALRTFAGMLASSHWRELPASLQAVISDVDGCGTDLGVFLERADVLVLRDGAALVGVLPPLHLWPSEGDRQQALRHGDRLSLPRLALLPRRDVLNWQRPTPQGSLMGCASACRTPGLRTHPSSPIPPSPFNTRGSMDRWPSITTAWRWRPASWWRIRRHHPAGAASASPCSTTAAFASCP